MEPVTEADRAVVTAQLGRPPRARRPIASRGPCGDPAVVQPHPRLPDGSPFPTLFYLTCRRLCSAVSRLEASGLMREMTARLESEPDLAAAYRHAHESYLAQRDAIEPIGTDVGAGGRRGRVKCRPPPAAPPLAWGPGVTPLGAEALEAVGDWSAAGRCPDS